MTIQHKEIPEAELHELKGASTASQYEVPVSQGDGTTLFQLPVNRQLCIDSSSFNSQNPAGTGTALQVEFGAPASNSCATLDANGTITFLESGTYELIFSGRFSRTTSAGVAILAARWTLNGTQVGNSLAFELDNGDFTIPVQLETTTNFTAGDELRVEILRDTAGIDNGGLIPQIVSTPTWSDAPSARVQVRHVFGIQATVAT
jgi:hypothetical protein